MALRAFDPLVFSNQGIPGVFLVVECRPFPIDFGVADFALLPEFPLVVVVLAVAVGATRRRFVNEQRRDVAFGTCDLQMFSEQLKLRLLRVIEIDFFPTVCNVTGVALLPELPLVIVVFHMAVGTSGRRVRKQPGCVTFCAFHGRVLAQQGELGLLMVEFSDLLPSPFDVAPLAGVAKLAFMRIVLLVTGGTAAGNLISLIHMASRAAHGNVLADERIFRFRVIEPDSLPGLRGMTAGALGPQSALVWFLLFMAGHADFRRLLESRRRVTFVARQQPVAPRQGEPRLPVIKLRLLPTPGGVAAFALLTEDSPMLVVLTMASCTDRRGGGKRPGRVAFFARDLPVFRIQREFCL